MEGLLTSFYQGNDFTRPAFFELIAQEFIRDTPYPAARHIASVWSQSTASPRILWLLTRWETCYNVFLLMIEWWHLRYHNASFSEHFFGLRRQQRMPAQKLTALEAVELQRRRKQSPNLTLRQCIASLLSVVLFPHLLRQCELLYHEAQGVPIASRTSFQRLWVKLYPWLHAVSNAAAVSYRVAYLLERSNLWSPLLHSLQLELVRDLPEVAPQDDGPKSVLQKLQDVAGTLGMGSWWAILYSMQFLQWWYQRDHLLKPFQPRKVPPPPPARSPYQSRDIGLGKSGEDNRQPELVLLPQDRRVCPLCHGFRRNPALSCSGYAFCYACLVRHVERCAACPVTGQAMESAQIRRVRDN